MNDPYRTLAVGQSGDDVRALHARMLDLDATIEPGDLVHGFFGGSTRYELIALQHRLGLAATGAADSVTRRALREHPTPRYGYVVGLVLGPDELPIARATVQVMDRDLRSSQQLGEASTGEDGSYLVRYPPQRSQQLELDRPDIYPRVLLDGRVVHEPPVESTVFNAADLVSVTVRLAVRAVPDRSEYERLVSTLEPLFGQYDWTDLDQQQDVVFLAGETGFDRDRVGWVIVANRLARETEIPPYFFYALFVEETLAAAQRWLSLTPRLHITVGVPTGPLFHDIALLPDQDIETAVHAAVATFRVPQRLDDELPEILARLHRRRREAREWARHERQRVLRAQLAHLVQSDLHEQLQAVLDADPFGDLPGVLRRLQGLELVPPDPQAGDELGTLTLTELLGHDPALLRAVRDRFGISGNGDEHRLAEVTAAEWATAAGGPDTGDRARSAAGADPEGADRIGEAMQTRMAQRFPTTAFAARLARDDQPPLPHAAAVAAVLAANPDFDLARGDLRGLLAGPDAPLDPGARSALHAAQRVYRLAPNYDHTRALLTRGITSAAGVVRQGRQRFVRNFVRDGAAAPDALRAYHTAVDVHTGSLLLAGQLQSAAAATTLPALAAAAADLEPVTRDFPNMKSLFSTVDLCECEDCRSVHGAAAYLVDVLQFLGDREVMDTTTSPAVTWQGARDVLLQRRPDLAVTDLNCANTNTSIPYLDLVCELLEQAVAPDPGLTCSGPVAAGPIPAALLAALQGAGLAFTAAAIVHGPDLDGAFVVRDTTAVAGISPEGGQWRVRVLRQTFGTDAERAAAPQYLNETAYQALAASSWCFTLPFDLAHQETRRYFTQFDVDRAELMRRLRTGGAPSEAAVAAERLGLSDAQRALVVTADPGNQPTIWNTPASPAAATLEVVDTFITRAGITYADLLELLNLDWVDGGQDLFVQHLDSSADLASKRIVNLDDTALDRIHRFIRARTATGWSNTTLDRVIRSGTGGDGTLDDACLIAISRLVEAATLLRLPIDSTLDILETLDVDDPTGAYARTFLDPIRVGSVDARFRPEAVHANEAAEAANPGTGVTLGAVVESLGLALGTSAADTGLLIDAVGTDPPLTAASVSAVHGLSRIALALGLSVRELTDLLAITGSDPRASADELAAFARAVTTMLASPLPIATWRWLLRHEASDPASRDLPDSTITTLLADLHDAYATARAADILTLSPSGTPAENTAAVRPLLAKLPGITATTLAQLQTVLTDDWTSPTQTEDAFIDAALGGYLDPSAIKAALAIRAAASRPREAEENAVIAEVAAAVGGYLYRIDREAVLVAAMVTALAVEEDLARVLLAARLKGPASSGDPSLWNLLLDDDTAPGTADLQQRAIRLLHVISVAIGKLEQPTLHLEWLLANAATLGWLELDRLPYASGQPATSFPAWERMHGWLDLLARYPDVVNPADARTRYTVNGFFDTVLAGSPAADLLTYLAVLTGTDADLLVALDGQLGLSTPDVSRYRDPGTVNDLLATVALLRTLGLDVPTAVQVSQPVLTLADAQAMRLALKSRYADAEWLGVLRQIQDPLRELKRDALVAYLLADNSDLGGVDDLYDHFLIDAQMTAGMSTSRIVQAHATVQLFVMRCLMGLEPAAVASVAEDDGWAQWDWMANFRVWEANRKIFLWPENWILPELRDDKSELFLDLENTLQQDTLTDTAIELATDAYLEALDDVAHLEVMAAYYDATAYVEHVFARTRGGSPAVYFHREFVQERAWTPWRKVPLDITGEQLLAFSRNSRLTLAWPEFTKEPRDDEDPPDVPDPANLSGGQSTKKPDQRWKIQLAMSEFTGGRWREKRVSDTALYTDWYGHDSLPGEVEFTMLVWSVGANQAVSCFQGGSFLGSFALTGCKGLPEAHSGGSMPTWLFPRFAHTDLDSGRFMEQRAEQGSPLAIQQLAGQTPQRIFDRTPSGLFEVTYPLQMTILDWIVLFLQLWSTQQASRGAGEFTAARGMPLPLGTLLPYFFGDYARDYVLVPGFYPRGRRRPDRDGGPDIRSAPGLADDLAHADAEREIEECKRTVSDVLRLVEDVIALVTRYLHKHQQDPSVPLADLVQQAKQDPDFLAIVAELRSYSRLRYGLQVRNFHHPLVCRFRQRLNGGGIPALLARELQLTDTGFDFAATYQPGPLVIEPYPRENVDFGLAGAYASYNWELFFHLPFHTAMRLNADQQFDKARDWFHFIFNPVGAGEEPAPRRYWATKPFFEKTPAEYLAERLDIVLGAIGADPSAATIGELAFAVSQWRKNPFKPDVVARSRPVAYQMTIVLNYVKNLVDWGDSLFRQFTRESVNQATQLYILADRLLGPKPRIVPPAVPVPDMTYQQLRGEIDIFGNALLDLESLVPDLNVLPHQGAELPPPPATLTSLYFCIPPNEKLLETWDQVADRLFKIRHCQNIDGIAASLALFSPPIDPGALVRAVAAGLDISSFLAGLGSPPSHYRFTTMAAKATELTQHVATLGAELLSALEKKDGEALARLRDQQEIAVLNAVRGVKLASIEEAKGAVEALRRQQEVIQERISFYSSLDYMNTWESTAVSLNAASLVGEAAVALGYALAGGLKLIPTFMAGAAGFGGSPTVNASMGGESIGGSAETAVSVLSSLTRTADKAAGMAATQGGYQRRSEEWQFQLTLAERDLAQVQQQIANGELHLDTLARDLAVHDLQTKNSQQLQKFMMTKYTRQELYTWIIDQVRSVYHQAYKLAYDTAKKAERCYGYELARDDTFISFGYWSSQLKGLMSADALLHDIKRMEAAYLDHNVREYELTKHVSLAQLDPGALLQLKSTGKVTITVPEVAFDLDHPNHYLRRIKTVATSVVCNAGPYTTVGMTLSLVANRYRKSTAARPGAVSDKDKYAEDTGNDSRFAYNVGSISSIATSTAVSDSGLFELNFHDERYLPFEGAGAISTWQIKLPTAYPQFDHDTISDLILHIRYTAREGGATFRTMTEKALGAILNETVLTAGRKGLHVAFSVRDSFPNEWWQLTENGSTTLTIDEQHLPYLARAKGPAQKPVLKSLTWAAQVTGAPASYPITVSGTATTLNHDATMKSLCVGSAGTASFGSSLTLSCDATNLIDLSVLVSYTIP
ncbi:neuraminidase-like domain-containing protein [Micromonospora sp. B11E3]|uniref:Tc toxin subunit A-related protein n=1 Tax=Micromonospora sp. B11E3 TaxID=3153562 RepID=UPI00325E1A7F